MLQDLTNAGASGSTPPPCSKQGVKNDHSPWSAPRERKRRTKPADIALSSIEEIEYATSPPKRHNGGTSPAARELSLQEAPLGSPFAVEGALAAAAAEAGPLAQGLFAAVGPAAAAGGSRSSGDAHFSPLASGLAAPSFAAGCQQPWGGGGDKQRKHLRQAAAFRLATARQRAADTGAAGPPSSSLPLGGSASVEVDRTAAFSHAHHQAPDGLGSLLWQPAPNHAARQAPPFLAREQQQAAAAAGPSAQQRCQAPELPPLPSLTALVMQPQPPSLQQQHAAEVDGHGGHGQQAGHSHAAAERHSTGQDMETDLRCSWGSDCSADVSGWQGVQARLRDAANLAASPGPSLRGSPAGSLLGEQAGAARQPAAACRRQSSLADDPMRASADGAMSTRSSLDGGPSCSERQTSLVPLRAAMRSQQWHSHLASPPVDGASPDPLLGRSSGPTSGRRRSRGAGSSGGTMKWGCFSCASPFSCKQRPRQDDSDEEVVRRNESEGDFVIRRQPSLPSPAVSRGTADRAKHTTLNRPPPGEAPDLVGRQDAFSARCTPGALWSSPGSVAASDDSFSLPSGPGLHNIGLRDASIEELVGGGGGEAEPPTPTVDALNDMLKALSLCPTAHPKDAEELVTQACQDHAIQPNATTARTLEKMWAVHEQLYG